MSKKSKTPARPKRQPNEGERKTRRRARTAEARRRQRRIGEIAARTYENALYRHPRRSRTFNVTRTSTRARIRKVAALGRRIAEPFGNEEPWKQAMSEQGYYRRKNAVLAQEARRAGLCLMTAQKIANPRR